MSNLFQPDLCGIPTFEESAHNPFAAMMAANKNIYMYCLNPFLFYLFLNSIF